MEKILEEFSRIPTPCISDALGGMNGLDHAIKPLQEDYRVCGRAMTVKAPAGDNRIVLEALRRSEPGKVLVVDMKGETYRATMGDFMVGLARTLGIVGLVFDGVIRDIADIKALRFPVFCRGTCMAASAKSGGGEIDVPVSCGGVSIKPGDIVVGDADGVVVVPYEREEETLVEARRKVEKDRERAERVGTSREGAIKYLDSILG